MVKYTLRAAACAAALALAVPSVGWASGSGGSEPVPPTSQSGPADPFLTDGIAVLHALDAIAARSGRPLRVTDISANDVEGLTVDVQEPAHHVNVDRYVVAPDGTISDPVAVRVDPQAWDSEANVDVPVTAAVVDRQAFDPKALGFARLAQTAREAIAKSHFPDAHVVSWQFRGIRPGSYRWMYLQAARCEPAAELDAALRIVHFEFS